MVLRIPDELWWGKLLAGQAGRVASPTNLGVQELARLVRLKSSQVWPNTSANLFRVCNTDDTILHNPTNSSFWQFKCSTYWIIHGTRHAKSSKICSEGSLGKPAAFGFSILWVVAIEVAKMQYFQFWSLSPPLTIELHIHEGATFLKPFKYTFQVHVLPRIWNHVTSSSTLALLAPASCYIKLRLHFNRFDWPLHISSSYEPSCILTHFENWGVVATSLFSVFIGAKLLFCYSSWILFDAIKHQLQYWVYDAAHSIASNWNVIRLCPQACIKHCKYKTQQVWYCKITASEGTLVGFHNSQRAESIHLHLPSTGMWYILPGQLCQAHSCRYIFAFDATFSLRKCWKYAQCILCTHPLANWQAKGGVGGVCILAIRYPTHRTAAVSIRYQVSDTQRTAVLQYWCSAVSDL